MPSAKAKAAARAAADAAAAQAKEEEMLGERPEIGKSALRASTTEQLAQAFTLYFFVACYWNNAERGTADRYSLDDPNLANVLVILALSFFWVVHRKLSDAWNAALMPMLGGAVFVFGCWRHIAHMGLYSDASAFVPNAWMGLAAIHFFGAAMATANGTMRASEGKISFGVPAGALVLALAVFLAVPTTGPIAMTNEQLKFPHPSPITSQYVVMDDGVRLAADIYLPTGTLLGNDTAATTATSNDNNATDANSMMNAAARVPVVIQPTRSGRAREVLWPFNKFQIFASTDTKRAPGGGVDGAVSALRRAGYAVVVVDARGTGASFGRRGPTLHPREMRDVAEMVRWARQQPWCNGTVALLGAGADGATVALAAARGAGADVVATVDAPVDPYSDEMAPGGVGCTGYINSMAAFYAANEQGAPLGRVASSEDSGWMQLLMNYALGGVPPVVGWENDGMASVMEAHRNNFDTNAHVESSGAGGVFRDDSLGVSSGQNNLTYEAIDASVRIANGLHKHGVPLLSIAGYTSGRSAGAATSLHSRGLPDGSRLVLGPWGGAGRTCANASPSACESSTPASLTVEFFNCVIRGQCTGSDESSAAPKVTYYTEGAGWMMSDSFPSNGVAPRTFFFSKDGALTATTSERSEVAYDVDTSATTGAMSRWNIARGVLGLPMMPTPTMANSNGYLVFTSEPLTTDTTMTGSASVTVVVEPVDGSDAAVFAYLEEMSADGTVTMVTEGVVRASHSVTSRVVNANVGHPEPFSRSFSRSAMRSMQAGSPTTVEITLEPTSHVFAAGSRVRLAVAGADRDNFATESLDVATKWRVHLDASSITLPITNA